MSPELKEYIIHFATLIASQLDPEVTAEIDKEGNQWRVNLTTQNPNNELLLEPEIIYSIQHIVRVLVHKKFPQDRTHFLFDVNDGRKKREQALNQKIPEIAQNIVLKDGQTIILTNLSAYERKLIHGILADINGLTTGSVGPENNRKLLIMPSSDVATGGMENSVVMTMKDLL
jgi:spoIIIJ-associated protein